MRLTITSRSENDTQCIGKSIGERLKGSEIILLESDLGGGKTTLTRGLTEALGSQEQVTSPTFTISQVYGSGRLEVHHYDLYRLGEIGLMNQEIQEVLSLENGVVVIEWPGLATESLPADRIIHISLERQKSGEDDRRITIEYPVELAYAVDPDVLEDAPCR